MDQTVWPLAFPSFPPRHVKSATVSSIWIPKCWRYHWTRAFGFFALKKMPPMPVTRARGFRAVMSQSRHPGYLSRGPPPGSVLHRRREARDRFREDRRSGEPLPRCPLDGPNEGGRHADRRALPDALRAVREGRPPLCELPGEPRHLHGRRDPRVREARGERLPVLVVHRPFVQDLPDRLCRPADDLALHHGGVEGPPDVVVRPALPHPHGPRRIDVRGDEVRAKGVQVLGLAVVHLSVVRSREKSLRGVLARLLRHLRSKATRHLDEGGPAHDRGPAPPGAHPLLEHRRVARLEVYQIRGDPQLLGKEGSDERFVSLAVDVPAEPHLHPSAVHANARAFPRRGLGD